MRIVGGDPVEELFCPQQRLVDEAGLRVEVEVGGQLGGEIDVVVERPVVGGAQFGEDGLDASLCGRLAGRAQLGVGGAGDVDEPLGVAA